MRQGHQLADGSTRQFTSAEYQQLIDGVREIVLRTVPAGARVLVVSRGDEQLVRFENRDAWHFPRAENGEYAGYHPADGAEAVQLLQALHAKGAQYLVIPASCLWWLDFYEEFADYLNAKAINVCDDSVGVVYALPGTPIEMLQESDGLARPLRRLLKALLPEGAGVAVVSSGDSRLLALDGFKAEHFPQGSGGRFAGEMDGGTPAAIEQLANLSKRGAEFLVVPHVAPSWLDSHPGFLDEVEVHYRRIARRENVCTLYELSGENGHGNPNLEHSSEARLSRLGRILKKRS